MYYFATPYTIHFDDTMAYGSHHFLTGFKFQCESRESFLFGPTIFDWPGVREALDGLHLLTSDAYSRNLSPLRIGDRAAILLTIEEWGKASARFCYRVISEQGEPVAVGFQTLVCADAKTGEPVLMPPPLLAAMDSNREIEEPHADESFRVRALAGGEKASSLIGASEVATVLDFLRERQPKSEIVRSKPVPTAAAGTSSTRPTASAAEAWVFAGQGAFDAKLLAERVAWCRAHGALTQDEMIAGTEIIAKLLGVSAEELFGGDADQCRTAVKDNPDLLQPAIHLQNVLGARLLSSSGRRAVVLVGQSFGEIAALEAAGAFDLPNGLAVVCERVRAVREHAPQGGGLLAVATDRSTVAADFVWLGTEGLVVAGRNHDRQTIVSGPIGQLDRLADYYRGTGIAAVRVPSPTSFHHPCLTEAASSWTTHLLGVPFEPTKGLVYSPIGRRIVRSDEDLRAVIASQLLAPFDLQGAVFDLMESGVSRFIDCGSTGSLKSLLAKAAPDGTSVLGAEESLSAEGPSRSHAPAATMPQPPAKGHDHHVDQDVEQRVDPVERLGTPAAVAIVGQGCLLPGGAKGPAELFSAIMQQRSGLVDIRHQDPWWSEDFYSEKLTPDRSTTHLSGRVDDGDIARPPEVEQAVFDAFTRSQKLLCVALAPCVASLRGAERVLCLVGSTADGYEDQDTVSALRCAGLDPTEAVIDERFGLADSAGSEPHDAVQEVFDKVVRPGLRVVLVDAACASSLYTVALGVRAIHAGEADAVLAGGVFCPGPGNSCLFSQFRGTTATGLRPFDANADGVIFSEGAAFVTLRPVADAARLGLPTDVTVLGEGISSDGRSPSANVPQTHGQILALQRCYDAYGIDPKTINAVEAHGTSTPVGDATEIETLRRYFSDHVESPVPVHSLKGLLGHAGWAAGTASIVAACQYLQHGEFPAQAFFKSPNESLSRAEGILSALSEPRRLPDGVCRIAIDGFGFGGANAHLVIERRALGSSQPVEAASRDTRTAAAPEDLVLVGVSEIAPTEATPAGRRFDRSQIKPPEGRFLLPDLEDDLDVSQLLTMRLIDDLRGQLGEPSEASDQSTSIVLALSGKTERGVEATMRVLAPRLHRQLEGADPATDSLASSVQATRPSGPYTLQAMMPNVSAGRSCLTYNLNGPNFVVDAGPRSLDEAFFAASMLLKGPRGGECSLAVVVTIDANPWRPCRVGGEAYDEHAAALAVTTRLEAERRELPILGVVPTSIEGTSRNASTEGRVREVLSSIGPASASDAAQVQSSPADAPAAEDAAPLHKSVWVEKEVESSSSSPGSEGGMHEGVLVVVAAKEALVRETLDHLERTADRWRLVIVGESAPGIATAIGDSRVRASRRTSDDAIELLLEEIEAFGPGRVIGIDTPGSWNLSPTLDDVAAACLAEHLFLIAQRLEDCLTEGTTCLSAAFLDAWDGFPHPVSGAVAGLLKSIGREFPAVRAKVACSRDRSLSYVLSALEEEVELQDEDTEIVYDGPRRLVRRFAPEPVHEVASEPTPIGKGSVVIATGGARGVTAVMTEALLKDTGCTVVALGRSELEKPPTDLDDPNLETIYYQSFAEDHPGATGAEAKRAFDKAFARWEAHETAAQLAGLNGRFEYLRADITDHQSIEEAVDEVYRRHGRIDFVLHGAGVQFSKRLGRRTLAEFQQTLTVKLDGLRQLLEACKRRSDVTPPAHLLTSAFSIFGNDGQHDYGSANETLDRLAELVSSKEDVKWTSIPWLAWDSVGMTRGSEYKSLAAQRQLTPIDIPTGQAIFRRVVLGNAPGAVHIPIGPAEQLAYCVRTVPAECGASNRRVSERGLDLAGITCLDEHVVRGVPTLPGAWTVDRMVDVALRAHGGAAPVVTAILENVSFNRFVRSVDGQPATFRVVAQKGDQHIAVWLLGDVVHPSGAPLSRDVVFASANVSFSLSSPSIDLGSKLAANGAPRWSSGYASAIRDPYCSNAGGEVCLSGAFDCIDEIEIAERHRSAQFYPRASQLEGGNVIPAYQLDALWRLGAMYADRTNRDLYVPVRIGRLELSIGWLSESDPRAPVLLHSTAPVVEGGQATWAESVAMNATGEIAIAVWDASAVRMDGKPQSAGSSRNMSSEKRVANEASSAR